MNDSEENKGSKNTFQHLPTYTILRYIGTSGAPGYDYLSIMVEGKPSREQLLEIAQAVSQRYGAKTIDFMDNQAFLASNPPLGTWRHNDPSRVRQKDWSKRPSEQDIVLWEDFMQDSTYLLDIDEDRTINTLAEKHGLTKQETKAAINRVRDWIAT